MNNIRWVRNFEVINDVAISNQLAGLFLPKDICSVRFDPVIVRHVVVIPAQSEHLSAEDGPRQRDDELRLAVEVNRETERCLEEY